MKRRKEWGDAIAAAKFEAREFESYASVRRAMENLWNLACGKPIKFPAPDRRRREDREIPKAA